MAEIYGLIGKDLSHSYSPAIHKLFFQKTMIDGKYLLLPTIEEYLKETLDSITAAGIKGINITLPFKETIIKYIDGISAIAKSIGAVNTITIKDGFLWGDNTDYHGFGMALQRNNIAIKGKAAVILGTGGSAKAVGLYLINHGIKDLLFVSRSPVAGQNNLARDFKVQSYADLHKQNNFDILVNCTPVGMYPSLAFSPLPRQELEKFTTVFDLIYNPPRTLLLDYAHAMGAQTINGLYMLVAQGIKAQELWNGITIDQNVIEQIYQNIYKELLTC